MGKLILVGTPIGNPNDISISAMTYLKEAKNIVAENPQGLKILLDNLGLNKSDANIMYAHTWPMFVGDEGLVDKVVNLLQWGEDVYLVCDSGMPGVADPGEALVKACIQKGLPVISTPGPSAVIAASARTGCADSFYFGGFIPKDPEQIEPFLANHTNHLSPNLYMLINYFDGDILKSHVCQSLDGLIKMWGDRQGALCYNLTTSREYTVFDTLSYLKEHYIQTYIPDNEVMLVVDGLSQTLVMPISKSPKHM